MPHDTPLARTLLHRAFSPTTADQHYEDRIVKRPLFIAPRSPPPSARSLRRISLNARKEKEKAKQRNKSRKPRPLSAAKKRQLGLLEIPKEQAKWEIFVPLNRLWLGYMRDILGVGNVGGSAEGGGRAPYVSAANAGPILVSADMHGAMLEVVRSRCVSRVGLKGIVVRDSKSVFEVVTQKDSLKSIPKEHTMFRFEISKPQVEGQDAQKPLVFEILGEQFQNRAPDRANKKYKMHYQPDL
ncbi:ribonuclease-like protein P complex subunit Pop4 [Lophiostoma macrostomum CBS 122681]|uniref:Ribonuclease-like protein P complex subunit Pop4 n=1 Tax=Lophiostoma macrostomum CBS 122681 TaxID=1314788 RepID=A0A6A6SQG6_9PLEO|nr:ribonuclease-like protein P complex subunit Pop4 [Lophiostoma macrostomum CBS 122681]